MKPTPISNRQLTLLRKLNQKKYREREQLFITEGIRAVQQVLDNDIISVKALFFDEKQQYWMREEWKKYEHVKDWRIIPNAEFAKITDTQNPQGVLALCHMPAEKTIAEISSQSGVIIALDAIQDPGNLGTIIRTASWFDVQGLLSGRGTVDLFHPKVVRSTAGSTGTIPHINGDLTEMLDACSNKKWSVFLLDAGENSELISKINVPEKSIIVIGNEAHGVNPELPEKNYRKVRIPSKKNNANVESLNAGIAASIALYEMTNIPF